VRAVQRRPRLRWSGRAPLLLTVLAGVLVLLALTLPSRLEDVAPGAFVRLPVEAIVYLAIVLALPSRLVRLRTTLAVAAGFVLGLTAVFKVLDMGFLEALNRPFDPLIDWRYLGSLVETVRGSTGGPLGFLLLVLAGVLVVALLVVLPLSLLRVTRVAAWHRGLMLRAVAVLAALWVALSMLDVRTDAGPVASREVAAYVSGQVTRVPSELRDRREFARAAETDPMRRVPAADLLTGLQGKDVLFVFVESFGRVAVDGSSFAPGVTEVLDSGTRELRRKGFASQSAYLTSPTYGALSWLAHSTLQSGLWVDSQQRYDHLVTSPRLTLSRLFGRAGWRTVAVIPANNRDWPQGAFYHFDHVYDSRNVGYQGPRFGYPTMPDQYTLDAFHRLELATTHRRPVMAQINLITSHAPWSRTPRMIPPSAVGDGSVYDGMPEQLPSETDIWPSSERVRAAYGHAIEYSLEAVLSFMTTYGDENLVVVMLGDHQPATIVSGQDAGRDVPIAVAARDPAVLDRISGWGWTDGLRPASDAPAWRMDTFRDRFLNAYNRSVPRGGHPRHAP
jgi:hypothetical protein